MEIALKIKNKNCLDNKLDRQKKKSSFMIKIKGQYKNQFNKIFSSPEQFLLE